MDLIPAAFCRICRTYHTKSRGIIFRTVSAVGEGAQGRTGCIPEKEKETVSCMEYRRCCRGFWCGFSVLVSCGVKYKFLGVMFSFAFLCTSPDNNKLLTDDIRYLGVGGHLFAIAAQKSVDYGYDGYMYGFAANKELLDHYVETFNGEGIGVLHPYQFAIDEVNAKKIMEVYDYDWTDEERMNFINKYFLKLSKETPLIPGAKDVIDMLQKEGNELIIISARGGMIEEMKDVAIEKFNEEGISFNKYYWKQDDKLEVAKNENIDVMIDDSYDVCKKSSSNGIKTIYFRDKEMKVLEQNENLKEVSNWGEIYRYIKEMQSK